METSLKNVNRGKDLKQWVKKTLGTLLSEERKKRNLQIDELATMLKLERKHIEHVEYAQCSLKWHTYCRLLRLYRKNLKISLVEIRKE